VIQAAIDGGAVAAMPRRTDFRGRMLLARELSLVHTIVIPASGVVLRRQRGGRKQKFQPSKCSVGGTSPSPREGADGGRGAGGQATMKATNALKTSIAMRM